MISDSPRLVDFAGWPVDFNLHLPNKQVNILGEFFLGN